MMRSRKKMRLSGWDYSGEATYFLTICTKNRRPVLSRIVGCGILDAPTVELSKYGVLVVRSLDFLNKNDPLIEVHHQVVMPNHIHLLLSIHQKEEKGASGMPRPTDATLSKFVSSLKRFTNRKANLEIWQTGYYDHIIRDECDFQRHWQYIDNNPTNWLVDDYFIE